MLEKNLKNKVWYGDKLLFDYHHSIIKCLLQNLDLV